MIKVIGKDTTYEVEKVEEKWMLNGEPFSADLIHPSGNQYHVIHNNKGYTLEVVKADYKNREFEVLVNGNHYAFTAQDKFDDLLHQLGMDAQLSSAVEDVKAPMPGLVLDIKVAVGDTVAKGDPVLVLEAMKMENIIKSASDGVVAAIEVQSGQAVEKNQVLVSFEG
ncbi:acetyl-CoA carboxylase biotin carboxyl carrier protein subunit [bacterium SCSIO 12741]|nr:acetyl-CoA carboxylase biotin carboxyl carrier protein subunit [bacterium SCSIO 12741]